MSRRLTIATLATLAATASLAAPAHAATVPTISAAKTTVRLALDNYVQTVDGRLKIGYCPRVGFRSRACDVRVIGPVPDRFRAVVTYDTISDTYMIRIRRR